LGYRTVEKLWRYVKPFSYNTSVSRTDIQTDGQTDGRTDRRTDRRTELLYQYRASAAVCWRAIKTLTPPKSKNANLKKWSWIIHSQWKVLLATPRVSECWRNDVTLMTVAPMQCGPLCHHGGVIAAGALPVTNYLVWFLKVLNTFFVDFCSHSFWNVNDRTRDIILWLSS